MNFERLFKHLKKENGIFFEAGANDGRFQSYTYDLEKNYKWTGVLAEPAISAFKECKQNRPNSICLNVALVSDDSISEIEGDFDGHPMASVNGMRRNNQKKLIKAPATTLTKIFDIYFLNTPIDLVSIDVENFELEVLKGLNFAKHQPKFFLIEIYKPTYNDVEILLKSNGYTLLENITNYNKEQNPQWDGTHNDYLFGL